MPASPAATAEHNRQRILQTVRRIPAGCVASYALVAAVAGLPGRARLVGRVLADAGPGVPWHRVLGAQGRIVLPASSPAALEQRRRLEQEGVVFLGARVDFARQGWRPSDWAPVLD